ncbi:MAG: hypothetical protein QM702_21470 [Rubrivivax sp.]
MNGAPSALGVRFKVDTGFKGAETAALSVAAPEPALPGALLLLYIDTNSSTSASAPAGWTALGTDNNNNFAWWQSATAAKPQPNVTISAASAASLMLVALDAK